MSRPLLALSIVLLFWNAAAFRSWAQEPATDEPKPKELERAIDDVIGRTEIDVSTATRRDAPAYELPYQAFGRDPRNEPTIRTLQDVLVGRPSIVIQRTSYGQASPFLRNLTGYHTLLLVDGHRLNNSVYRSGPNEYWGTVDALSVDHLDAVLGPAAVLYGSDAVGGTVNALTLRRLPTGEDSCERRLALRYSSAENSLVGRAQVAGTVSNDFGFVFGATGTSFDDLRAGGDVGRQDHTGYSSQFGDAHLTLRVDEHWTADLLVQHAWLNDISRSHRTVFGTIYHGTQIGNDRRHNLDFERGLIGLTVAGEGLDGFADTMSFRLSHQTLEEELDRIRNNGAKEASGFDVGTFGLGVELSSPTNIGRLTYGLEWYHDDVDSYRKNYAASGALSSIAIQGPVGDDANYDLFGAYVQDQIAVSDDWDLILGTRLTYAAAEADGVQDPLNASNEIELDEDWLHLVGSGRVLWRACPELHLYGGVSQGFRAPNLSDLSRFDIARSGELEVPAPNLDPENFVAFEVGAKTRIGGFSGELAYYFTIIDDLAIRQPTNMMSGTNVIVAKSNDGDGHLQGMELLALYELDHNWSVAGKFSWTDGQLEEYPTSMPDLVEGPFSRVAPIQGRFSVQWQTTDGAFSVRPEVVVVDGQERLSASDLRDIQRIPPEGSPGYTLWNVHLAYRFRENSQAFLSIENIGDKNYRVHGSGTQEAGINLILGVDVTF